MIHIIQNNKCCGCGACQQICPQQCILMHEDKEGFLYPLVVTENCINCGLCEKVCPIINQSEERKPVEVYAAKNKNEEVRMQSSSGGIFTSLAEKVICDGGVVFGAKFDEQWNVVHDFTESMEGLGRFRGSKYVQSQIGNTYQQAKEFLIQGRKVLYSGTPCQIAGLRHYLRREYDNLITVDVICHGVPSPLVWRQYLKTIIRPQGGAGKNMVSSSLNVIPQIGDITFRDKSTGWQKYGFRVLKLSAREADENLVSASYLSSKDSIILCEPHDKNVFIRGFLSNLYLRPSCYACAVRSGKSGSDITIGDFWGIDNYHPEINDDKGVSAVLLNTEKGKTFYAHISVNNTLVSYAEVFADNVCLELSVAEPYNRDKFWSEFCKHGIGAISKLLDNKPSSWKRMKRLIKSILKKDVNICKNIVKVYI